ncbi:Glycosyltransferase involved in cell wall bisynthesis [Rhizobiales bacterium GAS191]|jgi:glycosyltransferase involved in cell wall biosynthesis|nr:Glycosyltransferase involved in cell wall bisynthesis [Rhizobiales bacterium GAS113]SEC04637.1 Glycosyltransferase involved in cell wall bisynthesis [Rhizobiales bacterium GAS191]
MRIAIAHENIVSRDAIGNDILGMHDVLADCGFDVQLIGQRVDAPTARRARTATLDEARQRRDFDMLIYHHSILWESGESLLRSIEVPRLLKYHNVTPPEFFADYSDHGVSLCRAGRAQTARLVALCDGGCLADSTYNARELTDTGAETVDIVPPFSSAGSMLRLARPQPVPPFRILFVGRLAPNKGHFDLITVIAAYVATFGPAIRLTIVGGISAHLSAYKAALDQLIDKMELRDHVELRDQVDDRTLHRLFMEASAFLCMSEHEGFCVPIIEAQAAGVPVIAVGSTAVAETIGPDQMVVERPQNRDDYLYVARLLHAVCTDDKLRRQVIAAGHRNVLNRFTPQAIAGRFMAALAPLFEQMPIPEQPQ